MELLPDEALLVVGAALAGLLNLRPGRAPDAKLKEHLGVYWGELVADVTAKGGLDPAGSSLGFQAKVSRKRRGKQ